MTTHVKIEHLYCTWHCVKRFTSIIDYFKIHCLKAPNTALRLMHTQHAPTWEPCCSDMFSPRPSTWLPHFIQASHQIPPLTEVTLCDSVPCPALFSSWPFPLCAISCTLLSTLPLPAFNYKLTEGRDFVHVSVAHG